MILNKNMMENLGQRMTYVMELKQLNPNKLSLLTNIHATTIKNYVDNKGKPDETKLDKIASVLDISAEWLKYGKGEMNQPETKKPSPKKEDDDSLSVFDRWAKIVQDLMEENKVLRQRLDERNNENRKK